MTALLMLKSRQINRGNDMRILIGALAVALLAGCASSPIPVSQAKPVPSDELYAFQSKPAGESGVITIVRDCGMVGSEFKTVRLITRNLPSIHVDCQHPVSIHMTSHKSTT